MEGTYKEKFPTSKRYRIVYHKEQCIGAFACVAAEPNTWEQNGAVADIIGGKEVTPDHETKDVYIKDLAEDELHNNIEAAQSCPVNCIHIFDFKEEKRVI